MESRYVTPSNSELAKLVESLPEWAREHFEERAGKGGKFGPKSKLSPELLADLKKEFKTFGGSKPDLAKKYKISVASLYRLVSDALHYVDYDTRELFFRIYILFVSSLRFADEMRHAERQIQMETISHRVATVARGRAGKEN